jgi:xylulokinase
MTSGPVILCADIGSSSLKAALIDADGQLYAFSRVTYQQDLRGAPGLTRMNAGGGVLAGDWERALRDAITGLGGQTALRPDAVCVSGNGPTLVPVTASGQALAPLHWYGGTRTEAPAGAALSSFFLPHVDAFAREAPEAYAKVWRFFSCQEWLSWRLGAEAVTVLPQALYEPYYWDQAQCAALALDTAKFPAFVTMGSIIGHLSDTAAGIFSLPAGIPIAAAGPDFIMALIGGAALEPGLVCDRAGSSEGINLCLAERVPAQSGFRVLPHAQSGRWNLGAVIPASGVIFEWYRQVSGQGERDYGDTLRDLLAPPAPVLTGSPDGERGLAALEAIGFSLRDVLGAFARQGFTITEMTVSGGQAKNDGWNQLKADIAGCSLRIPAIADGELAGDAAAAVLALDGTARLREAAGRIVRVERQFTPRREAGDYYGERYARWEEVWNTVRGGPASKR